jgi:hypothetical protein
MYNTLVPGWTANLFAVMQSPQLGPQQAGCILNRERKLRSSLIPSLEIYFDVHWVT